MRDGEPITVERAYKVLNVTLDASALAIKQAYRKLLKRWHPDLQQAGTRAHAESTEMSRRINQAYALIEHAPLRYQRFVNTASAGPHTGQWANAAWQDFIVRQALRTDADTPPRIDRVEFWVRFVCGAILGFFIAFGISLDVLTYPNSQKAVPDAVAVPVFLLVVIAFGLASARFGDRFWYSMLGLRNR